MSASDKAVSSLGRLRNAACHCGNRQGGSLEVAVEWHDEWRTRGLAIHAVVFSGLAIFRIVGYPYLTGLKEG
jgi:hypothetical protein